MIIEVCEAVNNTQLRRQFCFDSCTSGLRSFFGIKGPHGRTAPDGARLTLTASVRSWLALLWLVW